MGVLIQLTLGSVPARTSAAKSPGKVCRKAFLYSVEDGFSYWEKYGSTLSVVSPIFRMVSML
jgi:hypothetical protein